VLDVVDSGVYVKSVVLQEELGNVSHFLSHFHTHHLLGAGNLRDGVRVGEGCEGSIIDVDISKGSEVLLELMDCAAVEWFLLWFFFDNLLMDGFNHFRHWLGLHLVFGVIFAFGNWLTF